MTGIAIIAGLFALFGAGLGIYFTSEYFHQRHEKDCIKCREWTKAEGERYEKIH